MKPLVSIIVPNYNHDKFLDERLKSIFNQTYSNFEVILLDDCSTDTSQTILSKYHKYPRVSYYIVNKINSGSPFKQWKKGIELAEGDYVWIAESDDSCAVDFLENLVKSLTPEIVLAYCNSRNINDIGDDLGMNNWAASFDRLKWTNSYINHGGNEVKHYMRFRNCIPNASAVLFKKSAVDDSFFSNDFFYCGDWFFWIQLLKKGKVAYSNKQYNFFRKHNDTTRMTKNYLEEKKRFREYTLIVKKFSSTRSRLIYYKKYMWMLEEWLTKCKNFKFTKAVQIKMPFLLYLIFLQKYLKLKLKK